MTELQIFRNPEFGQIRSLMINGQPWFVGKDVAEALGYVKTRNAIETHVDEDDALNRGVTDSLGRQQRTIIINESGLYSLILGSKIPSAKKFKHWVTSEVLPSIRKTGSYTAHTSPASEPLDNHGAIEIILRASDKQLPYVVSLLRQQGYDLPEPAEAPVQIPAPKVDRWADRVNTTDMRKLMEEHHVTQKELSRRTGICKTSLSNYMNCKSRPTKEQYEIIVQAIIG